MRKRLSIAIGLLVLAALAGIVWQTLRHGEPIHQGKPLSFWLTGFELDDFQGKPSFNESVEAVREAGTNALPTLLRMLRTSDSDLKQRFKLLLRKQRVVQIHYVRADTQRWAATQGFMALGKLARYAVPQLDEISQQEISRGEKNRYAAEILDWLKQQDKEASDEAAKALKKSDAGNRIR